MLVLGCQVCLNRHVGPVGCWTVLLRVADDQRTEIVGALLDAGADWRARNKAGWTAEDLARTDACRGLLRAARERGAVAQAAASSCESNLRRRSL